MAGRAPIADRAGDPEGSGLGLFVAAALGLAARLLFSRVNPVNYDGYWHVFIARNLARESAALAHPPLFPFLLRQADAIRHSRFSYLSISLAAGTAAVVLFGLVLRKVCRNRAVPLIGALALALSPTAIALSGVAEAYMLCLAWLLAALLAYVELVAPEPPAPSRMRRAAFAAFGTLALLSHYAAGLFLAACALAPAVIAAVEPRYRAAWKRALPRRIAADAATFLLPASVGAFLILGRARPWLHRLSHVAGFYFDPARETVRGFLGRAVADTFHLFSPLKIESGALAIAVLCVFVAAVVAVAVADDRWRDPAVPGATPAVILVLLLGLGAVAGAAGLYPFGGAMRHQFLLMVFGLMAAVVAYDRVLPARSAAARRTFLGAAVALILVNAWGHGERRWRPRPEPFAADRDRFDRDFPGADEVHVDQFNLVGFFAQHHDWDWEFLGSVPGHPTIERYRLSRNGRSLALVAHRGLWNADPLEAGTYRELSEAPPQAASGSLVLYDVLQAPPGASAPDAALLRERVPVLARQAGLETVRLDVAGSDVFAQFRRAGTTASP